MVRIQEFDNELLVSFPYDADLVAKAKKIFPAKWDKENRLWRYHSLLREKVYAVFGLPCPPKRVSTNFVIENKPSDFLLKHQTMCLDIARKYPKFGFFLEMGSGKTIIALEILKHKNVKSLIVAPLSTLTTVWEKAFKQFYPDLKYINIYPYKKTDRRKLIQGFTGICLVNYEAFKIHFDEIYQSDYQCLIIDESSKMKGINTQIAKTLVKLSQKTESVYLLSGNPFPNTKLEIYPQADAIAPNFLGGNYYGFRNYYFYPADRNGYVWVEKTHFKEDLIERLKKICIFIKKSDILDLPEKVFEVREFEMSAEQKKIYSNMKTTLIAEIGDVKVISPTTLSKFMKLRQITSGFLYHPSGAIKFAGIKASVLNEVLEEIGDNQVIIWANFKEEIKQLLSMIPSSIGVYGEEGMTQEDKIKAIEDFKAGKYKYLIANPASIAHGQTLTNASYCVYYSLSWSSEEFLQSQDRIHRISQTKSCTYIILQAKDSIDGLIYKKLQGKEINAKEVLEHLKIKTSKEEDAENA